MTGKKKWLSRTATSTQRPVSPSWRGRRAATRSQLSEQEDRANQTVLSSCSIKRRRTHQKFQRTSVRGIVLLQPPARICSTGAKHRVATKRSTTEDYCHRRPLAQTSGTAAKNRNATSKRSTAANDRLAAACIVERNEDPTRLQSNMRWRADGEQRAFTAQVLVRAKNMAVEAAIVLVLELRGPAVAASLGPLRILDVEGRAPAAQGKIPHVATLLQPHRHIAGVGPLPRVAPTAIHLAIGAGFRTAQRGRRQEAVDMSRPNSLGMQVDEEQPRGHQVRPPLELRDQ
mmetsp:Transcript_11828/g.42285  ORF Transcript_11828/g.42285 Transcript_11828/m.42285 type:complete len:287 (-) Transcript_11828:782-1642(-)